MDTMAHFRLWQLTHTSKWSLNPQVSPSTHFKMAQHAWPDHTISWPRNLSWPKAWPTSVCWFSSLFDNHFHSHREIKIIHWKRLHLMTQLSPHHLHSSRSTTLSSVQSIEPSNVQTPCSLDWKSGFTHGMSIQVSALPCLTPLCHHNSTKKANIHERTWASGIN